MLFIDLDKSDFYTYMFMKVRVAMTFTQKYIKGNIRKGTLMAQAYHKEK